MPDTPDSNDNKKIPLSGDGDEKPKTGLLGNTKSDANQKADENNDEDETLPKPNPPRKKSSYKGINFARDTAVLSKDSPLFKRALNQQSDEDDTSGEYDLGGAREVILLIRGMVERVEMQENVIYKLGRFELGSNSPQEIDLTPYGALDRGVSRLHAQLHLEDDQLYITDLGSTNGTYVSGDRIDANDPVAVKKGDEILLGRLTVQILFR